MAVAALEEPLRAWIRMLRARHAGAGINTNALDEKMEMLIEALHEYIERLEEA